MATMTWKQLARRLIDALERYPKHQDETAMVRTGDVLYELDLFRSLSSGRLHLGPAYPYVSENDEEVSDRETTTLAPKPPQEEQETDKEAETEEEAVGTVNVQPSSFSSWPKEAE